MSKPPPSTFDLFGLKLPLRATLVMALVTIMLTADWYYNFAENFLPTPTYADKLRNAAYDHFVLYLVIPLLVVVFLFRQRPSEYGWRPGDWRMGLRLTAAAWLIAAPILYLAGRSPDVRAYYAAYYLNDFDVLFTAVVELVGWEFFFRGFLLWVLWDVAGPYAVVLQAVPFAMAHLSKPPLEAISTIFGGIAFGWVAWRTRSFYYSFLIHLFISVFIVFAAVYAR